jgi:uroporphyrin-III C-methyltransferase/precorrin-2 dehydrogenase/sirohydrochlorin ferrochelatase
LVEGQIVVRLKGGDPGIYAHGAEEIGIARRLGVPYQIVPGISAAQACAAYAGFPLTERDGARSVRLLSLYEDALEDASVWESLRSAKRDTLVFYMSSPHYTTITAKLLQLGFKADTPLMVIEHGSMDGQRTTASTLADFAVQHGGQRFASPNLLVIGDVVRWHAAHQWKEPNHVAA